MATSSESWLHYKMNHKSIWHEQINHNTFCSLFLFVASTYFRFFFSVLLLSDLRHLLSTWQWRISFVVFRQILCIMPVTCHSLKNASWTSIYRPMFLRYQTTHAFRLFPMHLNSQPLSFASRNRLDSLSDVFCCIPQAMFNIYWTTNF